VKALFGPLLILAGFALCVAAGYVLVLDVGWLSNRSATVALEGMTARFLAYDLASLVVGLAGFGVGWIWTGDAARQVDNPPPGPPASR